MDFVRQRSKVMRKRGFTLLEMAIVLVITGSVIGVLFAVRGQVGRRVYSNQATDQLNEIALNMRNLYTGRSTSYAVLGPLNYPATVGDFSAFTSKFVQQGVFPVEMLSPPPMTGATPCAGTVANNPWNLVAGACGGVGVGSAQVALTGTAAAPVQFAVRYTGVGNEDCADMVTHNSLPGRTTGLTQIIVNGVVIGSSVTTTGAYNATTPLPITSVKATAACVGGVNTIDWYYNLSG